MEANPIIKMVFVDLDGTLLKGVQTVTERTAAAFRRVREAGITPVITTGRLASEARFAAQAIGAEGYLIASNGQDVYRDYAKGERIYAQYMEDQQVFTIVEMLLKEDVFFQVYASDDRAYTPESRGALIDTCGWDEEHIAFFSQYTVHVGDVVAHMKENHIHATQLIVCVPDEKRHQRIAEALRGVGNLAVRSSGVPVIEILPRNVDKRRGVRAVAAVAGLTRDQIMVIGDSANDIGMFDEASICVAMGNACPALKAKANYYAPSNQEDGVAWALENILMNTRAGQTQGSIEYIRGKAIDKAMENTMRQYITGDLKLPQTLDWLYDANVESGISAYPHYCWEAPHFHTTTTEYCYILEGATKYVNLSSNEEFCFRKGDFYILHRDTPYLQKSYPGCRLLFFKIPGLNDKVRMDMTPEMEQWCADWSNRW